MNGFGHALSFADAARRSKNAVIQILQKAKRKLGGVHANVAALRRKEQITGERGNERSNPS
jgi:hypothetical protein